MIRERISYKLVFALSILVPIVSVVADKDWQWSSLLPLLGGVWFCFFVYGVLIASYILEPKPASFRALGGITLGVIGYIGLSFYKNGKEEWSYRIGAICSDGWHSSATGSGACSWHGGVREWLYVRGEHLYEPSEHLSRFLSGPENTFMVGLAIILIYAIVVDRWNSRFEEPTTPKENA